MRHRTGRWRRRLIWLCLAAGLAWGVSLAGQLYRHGQQPIDAVLVLGGSIQREAWVAAARAQGQSVPILISQGSQPPCIRTLFDRAGASSQAVWLETCAASTFDNYRYSLPRLQQWQARHVEVITSPGHLPRAAWLAHILLGSHGIRVRMTTVAEVGVPGNVEHGLKTAADVGRSLLWALVSQVYQLHCDRTMPLSAVHLPDWQGQEVRCEHQAGIEFPET